MSHQDEYRSLVIGEVKKILEQQNENSPFMDAREIWEKVVLPLLQLEADHWLEVFNGKRDTNQH
jgi:predicted lipoprotein